MKTLEELGISPAPWECGVNPFMATVLDGYEGKTIYANGSADTVPPVAWVNVVGGDTKSAIRNARIIAAAPELYEALRKMQDCFDYIRHTAWFMDANFVSIDKMNEASKCASDALAKAAGKGNSND